MKSICSYILLVIPIVCFLFLAPLTSAQAQGLSKSEKKAWKKRFKKMSVEAFKAMMDEYDALKEETGTLKREVNALTKANVATQEQIDAAVKNIENIGGGGSGGSVAGAEGTSAAQDFSKGLVFRVQIGAFSSKDLMGYVKNELPCNCTDSKMLMNYEKQRFKPEEDQGMNKYMVGTFRDYWEADLFKNYLCEMGVQGAFIVAYKDNRRIPDIKDVLSRADVDAIQKHLEGSPCGSGSLDGGGSSGGGGGSTPADSGSGSGGGGSDDW